jgi:hypothetical protein
MGEVEAFTEVTAVEVTAVVVTAAEVTAVVVMAVVERRWAPQRPSLCSSDG